MKQQVLIVLALCVTIALASYIDAKFTKPKGNKYNTRSGPRPGILNVHLVPHTHNDPGWLKTVDEYFMGANNSIQHAGVQYILDSVMLSLRANPDRRFIYVETSFFSRWWDEQTDEVKNELKGYLKTKRFEFISGGWVMNDEAAPMYTEIVDQMTVGHRWLYEQFGEDGIPRVGWHIDPFGHSSAQASLFARMGFDAFYFARIDYDDKINRLKNIEMEMIWRGSSTLGAANEIFTGVTYDGYGPPGGFCFDQFCDDLPVQDDYRLEDYNVKERVDDFVKAALDQGSHYKTNNIMMTMGSDFQYENANEWYKNLDKLIHYVNLDGRINVFYSTPSLYTDAVHAAGATWTVKTDDFFPYADGPHAYWSGYFTSRVALKGYVRQMSAQLQACKQMEVFNNGLGVQSSDLLKRAVGLAQHHDAVSGTEKQHVADDYTKRLTIGSQACEQLINSEIENIVHSSALSGAFQQCDLLNVSVCPASQYNDAFVGVAYNALDMSRTSYVRIPIAGRNATVYDASGRVLTSQATPVIANSDFTNQAAFDLVFQITVPPLGLTTFFVQNASETTSDDSHESSEPQRAANGDYSIANAAYTVTFDGNTNLVKSLTNRASGIATKLTQNFFWYNSSNDGDSEDHQPSGAYIFRPNSTTAFPVCSHVTVTRVTVGPVVQEVEQNWCGWITQVLRLYAGDSKLEADFQVGPIPFQDGNGKEVISRWDTDLASAKTWYTDSAGRDMMQRVRNYRATWNYNNTEPIAGNFVPVNSAIYLQDGASRFTILTDRSYAGASQFDGSLELMVHRRLLHDDYRGVGEPLNETGISGDGLIARAHAHIIFDTYANSPRIAKTGARHLNVPLTLAFTPLTGTISEWIQEHQVTWSAARTALPDNINLLTLEFTKSNEAIIRLDHMYEAGEDAVLSQPARVTLDDLFAPFTITSAVEYSLSANQPLSAIHRLQWKTATGQSEEGVEHVVRGSATDIIINPMEIRTFVVQLKRNTEPVSGQHVIHVN
eukprot:TRINITY_DN1813_c0_g1_i1.p1 TRINITY_DN1813_c0_g1~~TRINITY_DN1813_c0_g1_i1.p1  ORF type:complete len:1001 (-),score=263.05 TRINITY_DN1813_c0_g1_i1:1985-4987(-)